MGEKITDEEIITVKQSLKLDLDILSKLVSEHGTCFDESHRALDSIINTILYLSEYNGKFEDDIEKVLPAIWDTLF